MNTFVLFWEPGLIFSVRFWDLEVFLKLNFFKKNMKDKFTKKDKLVKNVNAADAARSASEIATALKNLFMILVMSVVAFSIAVLLGLVPNPLGKLGFLEQHSLLNKYDGTYNLFMGNVHGETRHCYNCVFIENGQISCSESHIYNARFDSSGNIVFNGPCPTGSLTAVGTFEGKIGGFHANAWEGGWTCDDGSSGGIESRWQISQSLT